METLVGIWGIGLKPTGDKDPFALRRHALSVINSFQQLGNVMRISSDIAEFRLSLDELLEFSLSVFPTGVLADNVVEELKLFIYERNANQVMLWFGAETVSAVFSKMPPLHEIMKRLRAVDKFARMTESPSLAAANKRVGNILKKVEGGVPVEVNPSLLNEPAEKALFDALSQIKPKADTEVESGNYTESLQMLAALKTPVDAFFDSVMVNADDPTLRNNRLALLSQLHQTMNRVADLSKLAV
jgi:glycyl-tRNA synthetase beta chain